MAARSFNVMSICAGVGAFDLSVALAVPGARTVLYVEREAHAAACLAARMAEGALDAAPVWTDLTRLDARPWRGVVDCIAAGLPCQPYSSAGKRTGDADERALWPHFVRIVRECRPRVVFLENVPPFLRFYGPVWERLHDLGYVHAPPMLVTAHEAGSIQRRRRLFVLAARASGEAGWRGPDRQGRQGLGVSGGIAPVCDDGGRDAREPDLRWRESDAGGGAVESADAASVGRAEGWAEPDGHRSRPGGGGNSFAADLGHERNGRAWRRGSGFADSGLASARTHLSGRNREWVGWVFDRERQILRHDADRCGVRCGICGTPWAAESPPVRVDSGPPRRVERLRAAGNVGAPPVVAAAALLYLAARLGVSA